MMNAIPINTPKIFMKEYESSNTDHLNAIVKGVPVKPLLQQVK